MRAIVIDDNEQYYDFIVKHLGEQFQFLPKAARSEFEARKALDANNVQLAFVDISLLDDTLSSTDPTVRRRPNHRVDSGLRLIRDLLTPRQDNSPPIAVVVITSHTDAGLLARVLELGPHGFWHKDDERQSLIQVAVDAVRAVKNLGPPYHSPGIHEHLKLYLAVLAEIDKYGKRSRRLRTILHLTARGCTTAGQLEAKLQESRPKPEQIGERMILEDLKVLRKIADSLRDTAAEGLIGSNTELGAWASRAGFGHLRDVI